MNGERAFNHTVANGGGTFRPSADLDGIPIEYDSGFQVGLGSMEGAPLFVVRDPSPSMYAAVVFWLRYASGLTGPVAIGSWVNDDDGLTYIEPSIWIQHRNAALALGRSLGEQSVLDWATFDCVPCADS